MASELEQRQEVVNEIEEQLKHLTDRQFDLESDRVVATQRLKSLEMERENIIEEENKLKSRIKDKREYAQQLAKLLVEMDEKLMQLRNKLTLYADEVTATSAQFK